MAIAAPVGVFAGIMGDLPDETHAWAVHDPNRPRPPVVAVHTDGVPSDALRLIGTDEAEYRTSWRRCKKSDDENPWPFSGGIVTSSHGSIETRRHFGDCQLHVEWCAPDDDNPQHGNSGVYLMGVYELQIINSHEIAPGKYHGIIRSADEQAGSVYGQLPPLTNPIRRPGQWQTYDILFHRPLRDADGKVLHPATVTVLFNGVLVQDHREIEGPTLYCARATSTRHPDRGPIRLQDHNGNVQFRNVWIRELNSPWESNLDSGTSTVDRKVVARQRREMVARLLEKLDSCEDCEGKLDLALEILGYCNEEPFLSAATKLADEEAERINTTSDASYWTKRVESLKWVFNVMRRTNNCLPMSWKLVEAVGSTERFWVDPKPERVTERIELFNGKDLSNWDTWLRTYGKNNDPQCVFTVSNGVIVVRGPEGYNGCIATRRSFRDYRLQVEFRFTGELFGKKLKQNAAPDSGILFHSTGPHGAFYQTWMSSWEYNLIVGANGDFWGVIDNRPGRYPRPDMRMTVRGKFKSAEASEFIYDPKGTKTIVLDTCARAVNSHVAPTYRNRAGDPVQDCEKPVGEWNVAELICDGDKATCILNGVVVNVGERVFPSYGKIQLQNESCGCEFRRITLLPLSDKVER